MLVRRDVWADAAAQTWTPVLLAYAQAVAAMQRRAPSDPSSWQFQAAVHDAMPPPPVTDDFRAQCQHNTWFFLPWHRSYLAHFEGMVRATLADLPGVPDEVRTEWALPYWGYERGGAAAVIPRAFRVRTMPDGRPNPLFRPGRNPLMARGAALPAQVVTTVNAMLETDFSEPPTANQPSGFGGSATGWHHIAGPGVPGALEITPHVTVHSTVGGDMAGFATAPLDPLFWLHHCTIDRLWAIWLTLGGRGNPTDRRWLQPRRVFHFHTADDGDVTTVPGDALRPEDLGYMYDDLTPPPDPLRRRRAGGPQERSTRADAPPPDLVGASEAPVELAGRPAETRFPLEPPDDVDAGRRRRGDPSGSPTRVYLGVTDVEGPDNPSLAYAVYLNAPDDDPESRDDYYVGSLAFFGIEAASDPDREHHGAPGLRFVFEVTEVVDALQAEGRWDPAEVTVSFQPLRPAEPVDPDLGPDDIDDAPAGDATQESVPPVRVGRVSLFYQ